MLMLDTVGFFLLVDVIAPAKSAFKWPTDGQPSGHQCHPITRIDDHWIGLHNSLQVCFFFHPIVWYSLHKFSV
jgi:hypothetical protein